MWFVFKGIKGVNDMLQIYIFGYVQRANFHGKIRCIRYICLYRKMIDLPLPDGRGGLARLQLFTGQIQRFEVRRLVPGHGL